MANIIQKECNYHNNYKFNNISPFHKKKGKKILVILLCNKIDNLFLYKIILII